MRYLLTAILLCLLATSASAVDITFSGSGSITTTGTGSVTVGGGACGCTAATGNILWSENFRDATNYCNSAMQTNETEEANATIDPNSTTVSDPDGGACEVLQLACSDNSANCNAFTSDTFTSQTGEVYVKWTFRLNGTWGDNAWTQVYLASIGNNIGPASNDVSFVMEDRGTNIEISIQTQALRKTVVSMAQTDTDWHTIIVRYPSDGAGGNNITYKWCPIGVCGTETDTGSDDANHDTSRALIGWSTSTPGDEPDIFLGEFTVCNSSGGSDCGW